MQSYFVSGMSGTIQYCTVSYSELNSSGSLKQERIPTVENTDCTVQYCTHGMIQKYDRDLCLLLFCPVLLLTTSS